MNTYTLNKLINKAELILPKIDERSKSKHVSFVLQGRKIISYGYNDGWHSHPISARLNVRYAAKHSELSAIIKTRWRIDKLKKLTLVNLRFRRDGSLGMSKPCEFCQTMLDSFGIKDIWYTNSSGKFEKYG